MYCLIFMLSPCILYFVDIIRNLNCAPSCKTIQPRTDICAEEESLHDRSLNMNMSRLLMVFLPLSVLLWPLIVTSKKAYMLYKYHTSQGHEKINWKAHSTEMGHKAGMVHLSEVCIESTFLSILNWYILLPNLLMNLNIYLDTHDNSLILTAVSFLLSIVSLAWSYTSYIAEQKDGALAITGILQAGSSCSFQTCS